MRGWVTGGRWRGDYERVGGMRGCVLLYDQVTREHLGEERRGEGVMRGVRKGCILF